MHMTKRTAKRIIKHMIKRIIKRIIKHKTMHIAIKNKRTAIIFKLFQCMLTASKHINRKLNSYGLNEFKNSETDHLIQLKELII